MRALGARPAGDLQQQRVYGPRQRPARAPRLAVMARQLGDKPVLMINSCTGKMGRAVAEAATRAGLRVLPYTLCGAGEAARAAGGRIEVAGQELELVEPSRRDAVIEGLKQQHPDLVMVDYTVPDAIMEMAALYQKHKTPFVMGTTGGDRGKLLKDTEAAGVYAVIAPQMGKQVVAFQAVMEMMGQTFPGAFSGYGLRVVESHQSTKKDTSGTAKAIVSSFNALGVDYDPSSIEMVREREAQLRDMRVPEGALAGHAFHTYRLTSPDGSVEFEFQHNVVGR
ncbi:4-hydroxy-tetrahydrodipicolinate reductase chloroplastic-like, partial [Raphidocelis subcapitata]